MVNEHLTNFAKDHELAIYDIEFVKEGPNWYFRIYIDKETGIGIEDCELISREAERFLDETDPILQAYMLEVSSPGLDRPLKKDADFEKYKGRMVDLKLYKAFEKRKQYSGTLDGLENGIVKITEADGTVFEFKREEVSLCRLRVEF